jgi:hypothetical protein
MMLHRGTLVRTDVSEERIASIIRVTRIGSNLLLTHSLHSDNGGDTFLETSLLTRATRRHVIEDGILHSHRRENLRLYIAYTSLSLHVLYFYYNLKGLTTLCYVHHPEFQTGNHNVSETGSVFVFSWEEDDTPLGT